MCLQLNELKSSYQLLQSENETLKAQVSSERQKNERADKLAESKELAALTEKVGEAKFYRHRVERLVLTRACVQVELLEKSKRELQTSYDALKQSERCVRGRKSGAASCTVWCVLTESVVMSCFAVQVIKSQVYSRGNPSWKPSTTRSFASTLQPRQQQKVSGSRSRRCEQQKQLHAKRMTR